MRKEMRKDITIAAEVRNTRGKNEARRLRAAGSVPGILYGAGGEPESVAVSPKELTKILHSKTGHNTIFNLNIAAKETTPVMIVDWQLDPIKDKLLHVDLKRIDLNKRLHVNVPVVTHGDPRGVKQQGGLFEIVTREIEVECLPDDIPEQFDIDVSEMLIGQNLRASDIPLSGSMKLLSPSETVIVHVVAPKAETTAAATEVLPGAPAEPEVMKKGKKEAEGAAEPAKKK
jgi:large subunit ribosomal protein L25